jgi:hypothetical protein
MDPESFPHHPFAVRKAHGLPPFFAACRVEDPSGVTGVMASRMAGPLYEVNQSCQRLHKRVERMLGAATGSYMGGPASLFTVRLGEYETVRQRLRAK